MNINNAKKSQNFIVGVVAIALFLGSATLASAAINSSEEGYNFCVNNTTKVVTFPAATRCPKGSTLINFGARGATGATGPAGAVGAQGAKGDTGATGPAGAKGDTGAAGLNGLNGLNGSSLLGGVGFPNNTLGNNGDMYIDKNGAYIYGPKTSGIWGNPTAFSGPAGPKGETGATGPAGPAGPAGASTAATLSFVSAVEDGPVPSTGVLPTYDGANYQTILSVTIPTAGSYWVSFYTEIWGNNNQTSAVQGLCLLKKNGSQLSSSSQNNNKHFIQNLVSSASAGDVITLVCAQNVPGNGKAYKASGYALRVGN